MSETKPRTMTAEREAELRGCWTSDPFLVELDAERAAHEQTRKLLAHSIDVTPPESKDIDRLVYGTEANIQFLYKELQSLRQAREIARELAEAAERIVKTLPTSSLEEDLRAALAQWEAVRRGK